MTDAPEDSGFDVLAKLALPVWIVTATSGDCCGGLVATMVVSASIVETAPRLLIGLAKHHQTDELVSNSGAFVAHLIAPHQSELLVRFGTQSSRDTDKFSGLECQSRSTGTPILTDALAWFECRVEQTMDIGDRRVYVGAVVASGSNRKTAKSDSEPLAAQKAGDHPEPVLRPMTTGDIPNRLADDVLRLMKTQRNADAAVDAKSIDDWRAHIKTHPQLRNVPPHRETVHE